MTLASWHNTLVEYVGIALAEMTPDGMNDDAVAGSLC